jgi:ATP-binding protein involved in chromosome partitioning
MSDPRLLRALKTLSEVKRVYVVLSSKGGVGKSTVSTLLALYASSTGVPCGLLDLDFVNPSTHVILGLRAEDIKYQEERGVTPHRIGLLSYFTIVAYTRDLPLALRGESARSALREVLSIVNWGDLELLLVDTPPGISDEHLELIYALRGVIKPLVVATPSRLAWRSISKLVSILRDVGYSEVYLVENMGAGELERASSDLGVKYLGYIPVSKQLEESIGNPSRLLELDIKPHITKILAQLLTVQ